MKEYNKKPGNTSPTTDKQPEASRQAPAHTILQRYEESIQRTTPEEEELLQGKFDTAQREELDEEELLQGKFETVQREEIEEEDLLQGKFETAQRESTELPPSAGEANNTGLPDNLKTGIENLSGYSMDDVKVHYNSSKPAQLQALAYAQGTDIHIAPGQEKHLPHEAWHVVQQKQGRVQPTMQMQGVKVNDNEGLEREADVMGERVFLKNKNVEQNMEDQHINQSVAQLASDYGNLLPTHDSYEDEYSDGTGKTDVKEFTYHHIIPENKLKLVADEIIMIKNNLKDYNVSTDNNKSLNSSINSLVHSAKERWLETRIQDFHYFLNKEFVNDGLIFSRDIIKEILSRNKKSGFIKAAIQNEAKKQTKSKIDDDYKIKRSNLLEKVSALVKRIMSAKHEPVSPILKYKERLDDILSVFNDEIIDGEYLGQLSNFDLKKTEINDILINSIKSNERYYREKCDKINMDFYLGNDDLTIAFSNVKSSPLSLLVSKYALEVDDENDNHLRSAVQWNPGNIHRGPSSSKRLNPKDESFNAALDDGGDSFEEAANQILASDHYEALNTLNGNIDEFLQNKNKDEIKVSAAIEIIDKMKDLQRHGLTPFKSGNWEPISTIPGKMRLKPKLVDSVQETDSMVPMKKILIGSSILLSSIIVGGIIGKGLIYLSRKI